MLVRTGGTSRKKVVVAVESNFQQERARIEHSLSPEANAIVGSGSDKVLPC